jgi:GT2 family glycosyltransferase/SAM-dependent methyltransferase
MKFDGHNPDMHEPTSAATECPGSIPVLDEFDLSGAADRVRRVVAGARDRSSLSEEIEDAIADWPTEHALSAKRANLLRGFDLAGVRRVLEIGCGCGPITRFLGDQDIAVDAVESSPVKTDIARERCRGLDNVEIHCAEPESYQAAPGAYDLVLLVGFAGTKAAGEEDLRPAMARASDMLRRMSATLKEGGTLLIAGENRHGLKYALGAHEDRHELRHAGTHGYRDLTGACAFGREEWEEIMHSAELSPGDLYLPFPDYQVPTVLLAEQFVRADRYAYCHLEGMLSRDYRELFSPGRDENFLWEALHGAGALAALANSYCLLTGPINRPRQRLGEVDFAHLPGLSRKRQYCTVTRKRAGRKLVEKAPVAGPEELAVSDKTGVQHLPGPGPYLSGPLLSSEWARALAGSGSAAFEDELRNYWSFLEKLKDEKPKSLCIDSVPINIVVGSDGGYHLFDQEWMGDEPVRPEFLMFRALLLFAMRYPWALQRLALEWAVYDIREYVEYAFRVLSLDFAGHAAFVIGAEEAFQIEIQRRRGDSGTEAFLRQPLIRALEPLGEVRLDCLKGGRLIESVTLPGPDEDGRVRWKGELSETCADMDRLIVRFAPSDSRPMRRFVHASRLCLGVGRDAATSNRMLRLESQHAVAQNTRLRDLEFEQRDAGGVFITTGSRPAIELVLRDVRRPGENERFQLELDCAIPRTLEYLVARDRFLAGEAAAGRRVQQAESRVQRLEAEMEKIRSSELWQKFLTVAGWVEKYAHRPKRVVRELRDQWKKKGLVSASALTSEKWASNTQSAYESWAAQKGLWQPSDTVSASAIGISVILDAVGASTGVVLRTARSVMAQSAPPGELWIADRNLSFFRRSCLRAVAGETLRTVSNGDTEPAARLNQAAQTPRNYLAFVSAGDLLASNALEQVAETLQNGAVDLLYTDEDRLLPDGKIDQPHFKTDYAPDLLLSGDCIGNLLVIKREFFTRLGGFRAGLDGARLYDLMLRATEATDRVRHLAKPLYHGRPRKDGESGERHSAMRRALDDALLRRKVAGKVEDGHRPGQFRVRRRVQQRPLVSIVVPFRDRPELLRACVGSVLEKSTYRSFEILGVSNNTTTLSTFDRMQELMRSDDRVRFVECNVDFNLSRLVNFGVRRMQGEMVLLLNNDIEIITPEWIESLLEHAQRPEVGAVGGKLYFPDDTVQHAGVALGLGGYAGYPHRGFPRDSDGYFGRLRAVQNVSAVSGAMLMVRRETWNATGGFDEKNFTTTYGDVDFCLRLRERGLLNVFTPYAEAYRRDAGNLNDDHSTEDLRRRLHEQRKLLESHGTVIEAGDPYYNPNLDRNRDDFAWAP